VEEQQLTKREKRALAKEEKLQQRGRQDLFARLKKLSILAVVIAIFVYLVFSLYKSATKTLPGQEVPDLGAEHSSDISGITYNSNPPTSGKHFPIWAKKGIYDRVISDGYLLHSLEHGYIVISYNCSKKISNISRAWSFALKYQISNFFGNWKLEIGNWSESD